MSKLMLLHFAEMSTPATPAGLFLMTLALSARYATASPAPTSVAGSGATG